MVLAVLWRILWKTYHHVTYYMNQTLISDWIRRVSGYVYCTWTSLPISVGLLVCMDVEMRICCYPIERWAQRNQSVYMHIIAFHHTLQAVWIRACKHSLILLASRQESLHWLPFPAPRKWLMHLVYIITNVLFALQLNCDCYVQSMGKGHGIAPASTLMEKSMRIHFNHCGCGRMSTTLRDCQWPGNYRCLYRFLL